MDIHSIGMQIRTATSSPKVCTCFPQDVPHKHVQTFGEDVAVHICIPTRRCALCSARQRWVGVFSTFSGDLCRRQLIISDQNSIHKRAQSPCYKVSCPVMSVSASILGRSTHLISEIHILGRPMIDIQHHEIRRNLKKGVIRQHDIILLFKPIRH